jgi:hypothetical protein
MSKLNNKPEEELQQEPEQIQELPEIHEEPSKEQLPIVEEKEQIEPNEIEEDDQVVVINLKDSYYNNGETTSSYGQKVICSVINDSSDNEIDNDCI